MTRTIHRSVCPHDCPDTCALNVLVEDGKIVKVTGDKSHPITQGAICAKVTRYAERVYSPDRVLYPLRRTGPKGSGQFERISWDEAIATITSRWQAIIAEHGPLAIMPFYNGGTMGMANNGSMDRRFFNRLGASEMEMTVCDSAGDAGMTYTVGAMQGTDPEVSVHSDLIIAWGANLASTNLHQLTFAMQARKNGAKLICIDVHRNRTARVADHFFHVQPGSDAALALGMMHVIIRDNLYDAQYVAQHTLGFAQLRERVQEYPPERVAAICGLAADDIVWLARTYAGARAPFLCIGNGIQHHDNGGMQVRTLACLPGLVGAFAKLGGGCVRQNIYYTWNTDRLRRPDLRPAGPNRVIKMQELADALLTANDPPLQSLYVYNCNPASILPEIGKVERALSRADLFTVVHDTLLTDTARYADIVLPATTVFENQDLFKSYWHLYLQWVEPAIAPLGEAKSNLEVFGLLAAAMGFTEECFADGVADLARAALDPSVNPHHEGITVERLQTEQNVKLHHPNSHRAFADGNFPTPSGKLEFFSQTMADAGLDPLPAHVPLVEGPESDLRERYPLTCIVTAAHHGLNSSFVNTPGFNELEPEQVLELSPADAAARGIASGDTVRVFNDRGEAWAVAQVGDSVRPGVAVCLGLRWHRGNARARNLNVLTPSRTADMGNGIALFSNLVEVQRV